MSADSDPGSGVRVRVLMPGDAEAYCALREEMLVDSPWSFASSPGDDRARDAGRVRESLAGEEHDIAGAFVGGALVACAVVFRDRHEKMRHRAWIVSVYASPGVRGRGLGRAVMGLAIEKARGWGCRSCSLSVSTRAPEALALYESLGFVRWGVEPGVVALGGEYVDEIHLQLRV